MHKTTKLFIALTDAILSIALLTLSGLVAGESTSAIATILHLIIVASEVSEAVLGIQLAHFLK